MAGGMTSGGLSTNRGETASPVRRPGSQERRLTTCVVCRQGAIGGEHDLPRSVQRPSEQPGSHLNQPGCQRVIFTGNARGAGGQVMNRQGRLRDRSRTRHRTYLRSRSRRRLGQRVRSCSCAWCRGRNGCNRHHCVRQLRAAREPSQHPHVQVGAADHRACRRHTRDQRHCALNQHPEWRGSARSFFL